MAEESGRTEEMKRSANEGCGAKYTFLKGENRRSTKERRTKTELSGSWDQPAEKGKY